MMAVVGFPVERSKWFYEAAYYYLKLGDKSSPTDAEMYLKMKVPQQLSQQVIDIATRFSDKKATQ